MKFAIIPLLLVSAFLAGCTSTPKITDYPTLGEAPAVSGNPGANDIVVVGDKVELYVLEDDSFNGVYTVRDGGHIIFPKVGRIQVSGRTLSDAENIIKSTFEKTVLVKATVILERHGAREKSEQQAVRSIAAYLSGEVNREGPISVPFVGGMQPTAYQAIIHGGGPKDFAKLSKTYIIRNTGAGRTRIDVNLKDIGRGDSQDVPIQNGDIIVVPAKGLF